MREPGIAARVFSAPTASAVRIASPVESTPETERNRSSVCRRRYFAGANIVRSGGYKTTAGAHALSYVDSPVWDDVDMMGHPGGSVTLTVDMEQFFTFKA